jgi:3-dehydroquinate dehydratase-2
MLGIREPDIYGKQTYDDLVSYIEDAAVSMNIDVEIHQSNHEGDIINLIQNAYNNAAGIIINPAAYTHTSIGILDALKAVGLHTVEVHLSDVESREDFRKLSYVSLISDVTITGKGFEGYKEALEYFVSSNA